MRILTSAFVLCLCLTLSAADLAAESGPVTEMWRSEYGLPRAVAVDPATGTCWAATGSSIMRIAPDGTVIEQIDGFASPYSVCVNPADGSCWVADTFSNAVAHLVQDGSEVWRGGDVSLPIAVSVNSADGSCWVASMGDGDLVHLGSDGTEDRRVGGFQWEHPYDSGYTFLGECISTDPSDGSCWVADTDSGQVVHVAADGTELFRSATMPLPRAVAVDPNDGSCWVAAYERFGPLLVAHLASDGSVLWSSDQLGTPWQVAVNAADGSCVVTVDDEGSGTALVCLNPDGSERWRWVAEQLWNPYGVAVNPGNGSVWVGAWTSQEPGEAVSQVLRFDGTGSLLWRTGEGGRPMAVASNPVDGSCWVADGSSGNVLLVGSEDSILLRHRALPMYQCIPHSVSVSPVDGSCWMGAPPHWLCIISRAGVEMWSGHDITLGFHPVAAAPDGSVWLTTGDSSGGDDDHVLRVGTDGAELVRADGFEYPMGLSVHAVDGSCWVADTENGQVVHLSQSGGELWRGGSFDWPYAVSVNSADNSCWVADPLAGEVVHLAEGGAELWRGAGFDYPISVSANPTDGSCWVLEFHHVTLLAEDGSQLAHIGGFYTDLTGGPGLSVNPADGSCWVADHWNGQVVHLGVSGYDGPTFPDVLTYVWCYEQVDACCAAGVVSGYDDGLYHPERSVTRDQMAVYMARAMAGGDLTVPEYTGEPSFSDVGAEHWALKYVEYAVAAGVVEGYDDGQYHPEYEVDRAQMAVYIARAVAGGDGNVPDYAGPPTFPDVPESFWAFKYIEYIADPARAVTQGYPDGSYRPEVVVTRDQMAVYVARAFQLTG